MIGEAGEFFFGSRGATYFKESLFSAATLLKKTIQTMRRESSEEKNRKRRGPGGIK
jgi:CO/xanthine dehydrogenase Mo-binding subunit